MKTQNVLLAGATGYLGRHIATELQNQGYPTKIIVRNKDKVPYNVQYFETIVAEIPKLDTLNGIMKDVDAVISTVGITKQKDGLTYMDVDYQANMNLLKEARKSGVQKFIYVSAFNAQKLIHLKMFPPKNVLLKN